MAPTTPSIFSGSSSFNFSNSIMNKFSPPSSSTDEVTYTSNRKIVLDLLEGIFDDQKGENELSSSLCSSKGNSTSEYSFDNRLKYWKGMLEERKQISAAIQRMTGKTRADVLFNKPTTVDDRDKQMIKRVMDYEERMHPGTIINKKETPLPEYVDKNCRLINELRETLPLAERNQAKTVEIIGIPGVIKDELIGKRVNSKSLWLKSDALQQHIKEHHEDIERIIPFYPDIENLQIVGKSIIVNKIKPYSSIELKGLDSMEQISIDTSGRNQYNDESEVGWELASSLAPIDFGIKINGVAWIGVNGIQSARNILVDIDFNCEPFQYVTKHVMRVENIGNKMIVCNIMRRCYYDDKSASLFQPNEDVFVTTEMSFRIVGGESFDVIVQFRPCCVNIWKEKWMFKIEPSFFCCESDSVVIKLVGHCKPALLFSNKLDEVQRLVIDKSVLEMMRKLTTGVAKTAPMIQPAEVICPYKRTLYERELFELYNIGYKCERFHDLELLKDLHKRVKKPREPIWDLRLETLQETVLRLDSAERRALVFSEMMGILSEMRGTPEDLESDVNGNTERDRSRLIYVRGAVAKCIDEWEDLTITVEESFFKPLMEKHFTMLEEEMKQQKNQQIPNDLIEGMLLDDEKDMEDISNKIKKKMRHLKAFRDSLYIYTYNHLCDCVEDIVSIIESTEVM